MLRPRRAQRLDKMRVEDVGQALPDCVLPRHPVELFERPVPPNDMLVRVEDHQAVIERFEDVVVEFAHPAQFQHLEVELPVEPAVFDCRRNLTGDRGQECQVFAVEGLVGLFAPEREHCDRAAFEDARDEVVNPGVAPEFHFFCLEAGGGDRIIERDRGAGIEPRHQRRFTRQTRHRL